MNLMVLSLGENLCLFFVINLSVSSSRSIFLGCFNGNTISLEGLTALLFPGPLVFVASFPKPILVTELTAGIIIKPSFCQHENSQR